MNFRREEFYREFPARSVAADVHGILMRVASREDTLRGKIKAWSETTRRGSKRQKDLTDILHMVEAFRSLRELVPDEILARLQD